MRMLEQGPESQAASKNCWVGPSSVMNASDLDALTFDDEDPFRIGVKAVSYTHLTLPTILLV